ncbi:MAG: DUF4293 domain-containing protein [Bacteroidetes bacterium]|nr:DUF4293 domain-containing protein [Bacteroidota bacterium]
MTGECFYRLAKKDYLLLLSKFFFMIQRIQSLYLLIASILGIVSLFFNLGQSDQYILTTIDLLQVNAFPKIYHAYYGIMIILIALAGISTIFIFKNRGLQIRISRILILLLTINISLFAILFSSTEDLTPGFSAIVPFLQIILIFLALRAIKKDEALVRATDRIR